MAPTVGILGAGGAGLITAHTLLQDGFDVQVLTRDPTPGGVWATHRVYDGVTINNVYGEWRFSSLPMPPPAKSKETGGRLTGADMNRYFESFADRFLKGKILFNVEILNVSRNARGGWNVLVNDKINGLDNLLHYDKIVVCTGGCSEPSIPKDLASQMHMFQGPVCHSSQFKSRRDDILSASEGGNVVVVGGGKSAQDIASQLTKLGRKVTMVFETTDAFLANPIPLPKAIRSSRLLGTLSPHIELRTRAERFLHTTWLGGAIVRAAWNFLTWAAFDQFKIPKGSPLRNTHSLFWSIRINDEGVGSPNGFHNLAIAGEINIISPARVQSFGEDGKSIVLNDGRVIPADAVILATGFTSSWTNIFDTRTMSDIGLQRNPPSEASIRAAEQEWDYTSFRYKNKPAAHALSDQWCSSIYRGVLPAKSLLNRDFAINGAIFSTNNGYVWETSAHWISSYFLGDQFLKLPSSVEQTLARTERNAAWLRKRYPDMLLWANDSYSSNFAFFTWPQLCDELLEDMGLNSMRSGGNWLTWIFQTIDLKEIAELGEERRAKRLSLPGPDTP